MPQNPEILDATKLAFGGAEFVRLSEEDISEMNDYAIDGAEKIHSGSMREVEVYDPLQNCYLNAAEIYGLGEDLLPGHFVMLEWENSELNFWYINLDTGQVFEDDGVEEKEIDLASCHDLKIRILGGLAVLTEKSMEL